MIRKVCLTLIVAVSFASYGCKVIDPAEEIPAYINIQSVSFSAGANQGSSSCAITDAWIYVDGKLIGGFEIPCSVPVLADGYHTVLVLAGVKQNGMSSLRAIYPFYKGWESSVNLTRGQKTIITPAFTYFPAVLPKWNCVFSSIGTSLYSTGPVIYPGVFMVESGSEAFEGVSAKIDLNVTENYWLGTSTDSFLIDQSREIYLECNYKCDQPFTIAIRNCNDGGIMRWLQVAPSQQWNKIYVRLNDAFVGLPADDHYSVAFEMTNLVGSPSSTLRLDNLKLINQ